MDRIQTFQPTPIGQHFVMFQDTNSKNFVLLDKKNDDFSLTSDNKESLVSYVVNLKRGQKQAFTYIRDKLKYVNQDLDLYCYEDGIK